MSQSEWWPRSIVPLDRPCRMTTTFPIIKNYRDLLAGRVSSLEYSRLRSPFAVDVPLKPNKDP